MHVSRKKVGIVDIGGRGVGSWEGAGGSAKFWPGGSGFGPPGGEQVMTF